MSRGQDGKGPPQNQPRDMQGVSRSSVVVGSVPELSETLCLVQFLTGKKIQPILKVSPRKSRVCLLLQVSSPAVPSEGAVVPFPNILAQDPAWLLSACYGDHGVLRWPMVVANIQSIPSGDGPSPPRGCWRFGGCCWSFDGIKDAVTSCCDPSLFLSSAQKLLGRCLQQSGAAAEVIGGREEEGPSW